MQWLYLVPTMMLRIWRLPEAERLGRDVSSLEIAFHMAAPCPQWLKQAWIDWLGAEEMFELYGGTEMQAMTRHHGSEWLEHAARSGARSSARSKFATTTVDRPPARSR